MKKIVLSFATLTTLLIASGDTLSTAQAEAESADNILDRVHFKSDLRLRYESIERDDKANKYRNRYRLRLGTKIDLADNLQLEAGMRSGFANPTSGNQTFKNDEPLSDYFLKSLRVNVLGLAYTFDNSTIKVGRQPYLMYRPIKSQLIWDNDISMNGINYRYSDDAKIITLGLNQPTLEENSVAKDDVNLFLAQYVHKTTIEDAKVHLGTGIYYYDGLKENTTLFGKSKGNSVENGLYTNDYHIVEGFGEVYFQDLFFIPLKAAVGVVYNFAADDNNFGYDVAFQLGNTKKVGDWQVKYSYTDIEDDATLGASSDSDNFGGGTAAKGHALRGKYKIDNNVYLAGNFFFNKLYESKSKIESMQADYERVQLDCIVKF